MADVASSLFSWSTNEASNLPAGATTVGTGWDDNLRMMQKVTRGWLASKGADIASAGTTDLGAVEGLFHDITGTTTITGFGTVSAGIWKVIKFEGALTLTHNASSLIIPGGANITTADGDVAIVTSEGSGNWRVVAYVKASGGPILGSLSFLNITGAAAETSPAVDDELPMYDLSETANNKMTFANFLKVVNALTEDASPDTSNDFLLSYDASASAAKKVKPSNLTAGLVTAAGGASMALLDTKTASASATLDFTGLTGYDSYLFVFNNLLPATGGANLLNRVSVDNGSNWKSDATYSSTSSGLSQTSVNLAGSISSTATWGISGKVHWMNLGVVAVHFCTYESTYLLSGDSAVPFHAGGGSYSGVTTAINGIRFLMSAGNITSGVIKCYGLKSS